MERKNMFYGLAAFNALASLYNASIASYSHMKGNCETELMSIGVMTASFACAFYTFSRALGLVGEGDLEEKVKGEVK